MFQAESNVLLHRQVREQRIILEEQSDTPVSHRLVLPADGIKSTRSSRAIRPASGRTNPAMARSIMLLPAPDAPSSPTGVFSRP